MCLSQAETWISNVICHGRFVFNELWREAIARFVDIGGIVDYHCLNFLFIIINRKGLVDNLTSQSLSSFSVLEFENEWFALFWLVIMSIIIIKVLVFDKKTKFKENVYVTVT